MAKKAAPKDQPDASSGATETAKPVRTVEEIRKALAQLPEGTKERIAWEEHGQGHVSREVFRNLWLDVRVPKKTAPAKDESVK